MELNGTEMIGRAIPNHAAETTCDISTIPRRCGEAVAVRNSGTILSYEKQSLFLSRGRTCERVGIWCGSRMRDRSIWEKQSALSGSTVSDEIKPGKHLRSACAQTQGARAVPEFGRPEFGWNSIVQKVKDST